MNCPSCDAEMTALGDEHRVCPDCGYEWPSRRNPTPAQEPTGREKWLALLEGLNAHYTEVRNKLRFRYPQGKPR